MSSSRASPPETGRLIPYQTQLSSRGRDAPPSPRTGPLAERSAVLDRSQAAGPTARRGGPLCDPSAAQYLGASAAYMALNWPKASANA